MNTDDSRRRGGQPGNTNALKHGLYARLFRTSELARLQDVRPTGLQDEIDMFRLVIRRLVERSREIDGLESELRYVVVLSHALHELTRMVKVQRFLPRRSTAMDSAAIGALEQALDDFAKEWDSDADDADAELVAGSRTVSPAVLLPEPPPAAEP